MISPILLSIDQGTTSSRAMLFSAGGDIIGLRQKELKLYTPHSGWVEQNPEDIWNDTLWCIQSLMKDYPEEAARIASIGITNQRETTVIWDRKSGKPIYNAIVWQDRRTSDLCAGLKNAPPFILPQAGEASVASEGGVFLQRKKLYLTKPDFCSTLIFREPKSRGYWTMSMAREKKRKPGIWRSGRLIVFFSGVSRVGVCMQRMRQMLRGRCCIISANIGGMKIF